MNNAEIIEALERAKHHATGDLPWAFMNCIHEIDTALAALRAQQQEPHRYIFPCGVVTIKPDGVAEHQCERRQDV